MNGLAVKGIAVLALVVALVFGVTSYLDKVRDAGVREGIAAENAVWVAREKALVAEQNKRIDQLQNDATKLAADSKTAQDAAAKKIGELDRKLASNQRLNTVVYTQAGVAQTCAQQIYLGIEFSDQWNAYNTEVLQ